MKYLIIINAILIAFDCMTILIEVRSLKKGKEGIISRKARIVSLIIATVAIVAYWALSFR